MQSLTHIHNLKKTHLSFVEFDDVVVSKLAVDKEYFGQLRLIVRCSMHRSLFNNLESFLFKRCNFQAIHCFVCVSSSYQA